MVISPPNEAKNVPTTWYAASDFSGTNTGKGCQKLGYPITIQIPEIEENPIKSKQIEVKQGDNIIPIIVREPSNDPHFESAIAIIPTQPLKAQANYTVRIDLVTNDNKMIKKQWVFTTAP